MVNTSDFQSVCKQPVSVLSFGWETCFTLKACMVSAPTDVLFPESNTAVGLRKAQNKYDYVPSGFLDAVRLGGVSLPKRTATMIFFSLCY